MGKWIERDGPWIPHESRRRRPAILRLQETNLEQQEENQEIQYGVAYYVLRCPKCKSKKNKMYSSKPPIRYHKCLECGLNFKSIEKEA